MGKNSKARRDAKVKARRAQTRSDDRPAPSVGARQPHSHEARGTDDRTIDDRAVSEMLGLSAQAVISKDRYLPRLIDALTAVPATQLDRIAEAQLLRMLSTLWGSGWQPAELYRQARIAGVSPETVRLAGWLIATDHANRRAATLDRRWIEQVDGLQLPAVDGTPGWLERWTTAELLSRREVVNAIVDLHAVLLRLPAIEELIPPPGSTRVDPLGAARASASATSDPVLQRIRALLAKAESTTFEAEALAFTAKAQELMTRHAIDMVAVAGATGDGRPIVVRVPIDAPYVDAKSLLLQTVAGATRCRTVFSGELAFSSVVGFASDVAATEVLFTSLLLQAQQAMAEAARHTPPGTRTRSKAFRSSFLAAYTHRIGQRLDEVNRSVVAESAVTYGEALLPVLRSREVAVEEALTERFGTLRSKRVRGAYDEAGWASGSQAADLARLASGDIGAAG